MRALFLVLIASNVVFADANLQSLLSQYRKDSPALAAERYRIDASKEEANRSLAFPAPELGIEWGNKAQNPGMSNATMYYGGVTLSQEIMFPGKRKGMFEEGKSRSEMLDAERRQFEKEGSFRIAAIYTDLAMEQGRLPILSSLIQRLESMKEATMRQVTTGMGTMESVFRLDAEIARIKVDSTTIASSLLSMKNMLAGEMGLDSLPATPQRIQFAPIPMELPSEDSLIAMAYTRPEFNGMQAESRMARNEKANAELSRYPDLMLQGRYMTMMGPDEWSLMLGIKIPIAPWASQESHSSIMAAKSKDMAVQAKQNAMRRIFAQQIRSALVQINNNENSLSLIQRAEADAVRNASAAVQNSFRAGKSDVAMVIDAMRMETMTEERIWMASIAYYRSILTLEQTAGVEPGTWLKEIQ